MAKKNDTVSEEGVSTISDNNVNIVKKPGRPKGSTKKKKEEDVLNENVEHIVMNKQTINSPTNQTMVTTQDIQNGLNNFFKSVRGKNYTESDLRGILGTSFSNNPFIQNQRLKNINTPLRANNKINIQKALESPDNNEELLRSESNSLYFQNYVYNNLLKINREVPKFFNYVIPQNVSKEELNSKSFKDEMKFVNKFIQKMNIPVLCKDIAMDIALEGKRSYIYRSSYTDTDVDFVLLQKIPSKWIKYTKIGSNTSYVTSFDFMMFLQPGESVDFYPPFFRQIWDELINNEIVTVDKNNNKTFNVNNVNRLNYLLEYNNNRYMYWVELPQDVVFEFGSDNSNVLQIPDYVGLFADLRELDDYKWLQNKLLSSSINNVLVGTVPLAKNVEVGQDNTAISMDSIIGFTDIFNSAVSNNIMPFFAPFTDYKLFSLPLPQDAKEINNVALKNLINTSGCGALITTTDKPSIISVKTAQMLVESKAEYLTNQIEACINSIIKSLHLKYEYKVTIWGGIFTWKDDLKLYKELYLSGVKSLLPRILSPVGQSLEDCNVISDYIDSLELYDKFVPLSKLDVIDKTNGETPQVGRKPVGDDIENDNTAISIDQGNNVSDTKEFTSINTCIICGERLEDFENKICTQCIELEYNRLLNL